ncbi:hypothetical protein RO3G_07852 [Rhizopus delemar RA 99-880]|uniref:Uncharacterized protein n=1 Tax=Rhizopus delemar (strain RA 99-880 / ATCC MYA-4621 / FGSC 9543 / NRRL 43880) TaxID=246409 RepID=I1C3W7_RHIO9|nr:hypothetical protein RO3G_07852 [Rhizopus delemar RA 99-880]|eukprot:EIE83147.1 hypothetical protein RO3G_07852 [Rhizopus delemar RA 99-880]
MDDISSPRMVRAHTANTENTFFNKRRKESIHTAQDEKWEAVYSKSESKS